MRKILYMLLCILMLVWCTQQSSGNIGTSSSTTTDLVVTTTTPVIITTTSITTTSLNINFLFSVYRCDNWISNNFDSRIELTHPESGTSTDTIYIHLLENNDEISNSNDYNISLTPKINTTYNDRYIGVFENVENNTYKANLKKQKIINGLFYSIASDQKSIILYFSIDESKQGIYILGDSVNNEKNSFCPLTEY